MSKTVQFATSIVLGVLLVGSIGLGLAYGDDLHEIFESRDTPSTTERVQMQGIWMGMRLVPADTASELGQPTSPRGVRIDEVSERTGWRVRQAGLMSGDIIVSINTKKVGNVADLDGITKSLNASGAITLEVLRWGQPMKVVLAALPLGVPMPPVAPLVNPGAQPGPNAMPGSMPGATPLQPMPASMPNPAVGPGVGPAAGPGVTPSYYCPTHRQMYGAAQVHPHYRCPVCSTPLTRAQ
jgi:membrane-associated protease RseP (regulator of RpoE activity)